MNGDLASRLKRIRKKLDWSSERLAAELNVSHQTIYRWETGKATPHRFMRVALEIKLAELEHPQKTVAPGVRPV